MENGLSLFKAPTFVVLVLDTTVLAVVATILTLPMRDWTVPCTSMSAVDSLRP
jgi:hypothetical protein